MWSFSNLQAKLRAVPCSSFAPYFSNISTRGEFLSRTASAKGVLRKPQISSVFLKEKSAEIVSIRIIVKSHNLNNSPFTQIFTLTSDHFDLPWV